MEEEIGGKFDEDEEVEVLTRPEKSLVARAVCGSCRRLERDGWREVSCGAG